MRSKEATFPRRRRLLSAPGSTERSAPRFMLRRRGRRLASSRAVPRPPAPNGTPRARRQRQACRACRVPSGRVSIRPEPPLLASILEPGSGSGPDRTDTLVASGGRTSTGRTGPRTSIESRETKGRKRAQNRTSHSFPKRQTRRELGTQSHGAHEARRATERKNSHAAHPAPRIPCPLALPDRGARKNAGSTEGAQRRPRVGSCR